MDREIRGFRFVVTVEDHAAFDAALVAAQFPEEKAVGNGFVVQTDLRRSRPLKGTAQEL